MKKSASIFLVSCLGYITSLQAQNLVEIPDPKFRYFLQNHSQISECFVGNLLDTTCGGVLNLRQLESYTDNHIDNIEGIQYFKGLEQLRIENTNLGDMSSIKLPKSLYEITLINTHITKLPSLPARLSSLICNKNQLTSLPKLGNNLLQLNCENNSIKCLPFLPSSLKYLRTDRVCFINIPSSLVEAGYSQETCLSECEIKFPLVKGRVYQDRNNDGIYNSKIDLAIQGARVSSSLGETITDQTGIYTLQFDSLNTNYQITTSLNSSFSPALISDTVMFKNTTDIRRNKDFRFSLINPNLVEIPDTLFREFLKREYKIANCFVGNLLDTTCSLIANYTELSTNEFRDAYRSIEGIQYLKNLKDVRINYSPLGDLSKIVLPQKIESLYFFYNGGLTSLPELPKSLKKLTVYPYFSGEEDRKGLNKLPALPNGLVELSINHTNLTNLPVLPSSLKKLNCNNNKIESVISFSSNLETIDLSKNLLNCLPVLPNSLTKLNIDKGVCLNNIPSSVVIYEGEGSWSTENIIKGTLCDGNTNCLLALPEEIVNTIIYPNPSKGIFNLELGNETGQIELASYTGNVILEQTVNQSTSIDLSNYDKGIYFLKIQTNNKSKVVKLVVE